MINIAQIDHNDKSVEGVLGTRTRGCRMVGADESTDYGGTPWQNFSLQLRQSNLLIEYELNRFYRSFQGVAATSNASWEMGRRSKASSSESLRFRKHVAIGCVRYRAHVSNVKAVMYNFSTKFNAY